MATPKATLTDRAVKALKPKATVYRVRDASPKGFGVVVAPSGTRSFFLAYTSPETGKRTQGTIGAYPTVSLRDANETARKWRQHIREGVDPVLEAKRQKEATRAAREAEEAARKKEQALGTIKDLFDCYIADLEADGKRAAAQVRQIYRKDVAPYGDLKARDLDADLILEIVACVERRGSKVMANRTRTYVLAALRFGRAIKRKSRWRGRAPEFEIPLVDGTEVERPLETEPVGRRFLTPGELVQVWNADLPVHARCALRLLLSTGQRVEEVLGARWEEFDEQTWTIPATRRKTRHKVQSDHVVPLTDLHQQILNELRPYGGEYLFPSRRKPREERPLTYFWLGQVVTRFCKRLDMKPWTPRDCRRSFKTLGAKAGIDLELRNRLQGHALTDIGSKNYDCWEYLDEKRTAMLQWARYLETLLLDEPNVLPFRAAR
ncbi:MAG: tyrosine-type recombinase/integrase [Anaerolineae bacterium]|jgi:integrase